MLAVVTVAPPHLNLFAARTYTPPRKGPSLGGPSFTLFTADDAALISDRLCDAAASPSTRGWCASCWPTAVRARRLTRAHGKEGRKEGAKQRRAREALWGARRCSCWGARRVCVCGQRTACLLRSAIVGSAGRGAGGGRGGGCGAFERVPRPRSFVGVPPRSRETKSNRSPYPLRSRPKMLGLGRRCDQHNSICIMLYYYYSLFTHNYITLIIIVIVIHFRLTFTLSLSLLLLSQLALG